MRHLLKVMQVDLWNGAKRMYEREGANLEEDIMRGRLNPSELGQLIADYSIAGGDEGNIYSQLHKPYAMPTERQRLFGDMKGRINEQEVELTHQMGILIKSEGDPHQPGRFPFERLNLGQLRKIGEEMGLQEAKMPIFFIPNKGKTSDETDRVVESMQPIIQELIAEPAPLLKHDKDITRLAASLPVHANIEAIRDAGYKRG